MKVLILMLIVLLPGCSINIAHNSATGTPRWKQVLLENGTSPQCLEILKNVTSCKEFAESNRRIYQSLKRANLNTAVDPLQPYISGMLADIEHDLKVLVDLPECGIHP